MKDIAIIVVNYQMKEHIKKCLVSLFPQITHSSLDVEVVVVDNASDDHINLFLTEDYPQVRCIMLSENQGFGKAQNAGMKSVEAKYYFILNPDTEFTHGDRTLERLRDFMESHPKVGMIGPKLLNSDGSLQYSCWRFPSFWQPLFSRTKLGTIGRGKDVADHYFMKDFDHESTRPVDAIMGSAMFVRGESIKQVGRFDERFWMYFEDMDWCVRMWEAGWFVYYVHDIVLKHIHGRGSAKVPGIFKAFFKNKLARVHFVSWIKYFWKWRNTYPYYVSKF